MPPPSSGAVAQGEAPQRSIIIMHQRVKVKFCPPGMGALVKGQMLSMHTRNLSDLLSRFGGGAADARGPPAGRSSRSDEVEVQA